MDPYTTHTMIATVNIATGAKLDTREIGLKVTSAAGNMENDGDHDDSPEWTGDLLDTNELIVTLRLRAPNLVISEVSVSETSNEVDKTIPIRVKDCKTQEMFTRQISRLSYVNSVTQMRMY